jgi:hypothetical protein
LFENLLVENKLIIYVKASTGNVTTTYPVVLVNIKLPKVDLNFAPYFNETLTAVRIDLAVYKN